MNTRFATTAIAAALTVAAASSALAQDAGTLNVWGARVDAPRATAFGGPTSVGAARDADTVTTGSIERRRGNDGSPYRYSGPHAGGPANGLSRY